MGISLCGFSVVFGLLLDPETMPQNYNPSLEDIFTHFITPGMITFGTGFSFVSRDKLDTNLSKKTQAETMVELLEKGLLIDPNIIRNAEQERGKAKTLKK